MPRGGCCKFKFCFFSQLNFSNVLFFCDFCPGRNNTGESLEDVYVELDKGSDALEDSLTMNKFGPSYMKNIKLVSDSMFLFCFVAAHLICFDLPRLLCAL